MALGSLVRRITWSGSRRGPHRNGHPEPLGPEAALAEADRLRSDGRAVEAVDLLTAAWRHTPNGALEIRLRDLRHEAGRATAGVDAGAPETWPPRHPDPFPGTSAEVPETGAEKLSAELVGGAVLHHGAICVRGLLDESQVSCTMDVLRGARASQDADDRSRDYMPLRPEEGALRKNVERGHVRMHGGTWLADSPRATAVVLEELTVSGVIGALSEHFGERPHFSLEKSTLRRTPPEDRLTGWHQDGSFLGADVRTMNVWIALSACGGSRPASGLEVIPHRLEELLPKDPALGNAGVSLDLMEQLLAEKPSVRPEFLPGDALIFDERFMHRTALGPDLTEDRYALECWFFAPSHATADYTPLLA
jgi:hypothetical protein